MRSSFNVAASKKHLTFNFVMVVIKFKKYGIYFRDRGAGNRF